MSEFEDFITEHPFNIPNFSKFEEKENILENQSTAEEFNSLYPDERDKIYFSEDSFKRSNNSFDAFELNVKLMQQLPDIHISNEEDYEIEAEIEFKKKSELNEKNQNSVTKQIKKIKKESNNKYPFKNVPKIIGQTVISKTRTNSCISINKKLRALLETDEKINQFKEWIKLNNIHKKYTKLPTFREFWTYNEELNQKDRYYRFVIKEITRTFLEEEAYSYFVKAAIENKKFKDGKIQGYIELIPKFLTGIDYPSSLNNLEY